jgi:hypothetical protein
MESDKKSEPRSYKEQKEANKEHNRKAVLKYNEKYETKKLLPSS